MADTSDAVPPAKKPAAKKPATPKTPTASTPAAKAPAAKSPAAKAPAAKAPAAKKLAAKAATPAPTPIEPAPVVPVVPAAPAAAHQPNPYAASSASVPPPQGGQPAYYGAPANAAPQGLAITSMVLGIVSVLCCGIFVFGIGAVITGHLAQRSQPYAKGFWLTGIICGYASILLAIVYWGFQIIVFLGTGAMSYYSYN